MSQLYEKLLEVAAEQHGFVTSAQAKDQGVNPANVRQLASSGRLEKRHDGLYRLLGFPITDLSEYAEATLWAKGRGVIIDESALALWDLCDVNPQRICVGIPKSYRINREGMHRYTIRKIEVNPREVDDVSNIPTLTPFLAIERSIKFHTRGDLIEQAIETAERRGHLTKNHVARLRVANLDRASND